MFNKTKKLKKCVLMNKKEEGYLFVNILYVILKQ
jgi:hypothetical protein